MADKINWLKVVLVVQEKCSKWLAQQIGKSACTVRKWSNNVCQPDLKTFNNIANLLDVDVSRLSVSIKNNINSKHE